MTKEQEQGTDRPRMTANGQQANRLAQTANGQQEQGTGVRMTNRQRMTNQPRPTDQRPNLEHVGTDDQPTPAPVGGLVIHRNRPQANRPTDDRQRTKQGHRRPNRGTGVRMTNPRPKTRHRAQKQTTGAQTKPTPPPVGGLVIHRNRPQANRPTPPPQGHRPPTGQRMTAHRQRGTGTGRTRYTRYRKLRKLQSL